MTDGWVRTGDLTEIAQEMKDQALPSASLQLARALRNTWLRCPVRRRKLLSGNRYLRVPEFFLKETVKSVGNTLSKNRSILAFCTGPVCAAWKPQPPPLLGYNGTTGKIPPAWTAHPRGDPLLATWQYGLGRAAAWTSDLKGQWRRNGWLAASSASLRSWSAGFACSKVEGLTTEILMQDGEAIIQVQAIDKSGLPLNFLEGSAAIVDPDLETVHAPSNRSALESMKLQPTSIGLGPIWYV